MVKDVIKYKNKTEFFHKKHYDFEVSDFEISPDRELTEVEKNKILYFLFEKLKKFEAGEDDPDDRIYGQEFFIISSCRDVGVPPDEALNQLENYYMLYGIIRGSSFFDLIRKKILEIYSFNPDRLVRAEHIDRYNKWGHYSGFDFKSVRGRLVMDKKKEYYLLCEKNANIILESDPCLKFMKYDYFLDSFILTKRLDYNGFDFSYNNLRGGHVMEDSDLAVIADYIGRKYSLSLNKNRVAEYIEKFKSISSRRTHIFRRLLENIYERYDLFGKRDKKSIDASYQICANFLIKHLGLEGVNDDLKLMYKKISKILFTSIVNRIYNPGSKNDTVLVLKSTRQGKGKDKFFDNLTYGFTLNTSVKTDAKKTLEDSSGKVLIHWSDIANLSSSGIDELKAIISNISDKARMAYARLPVERMRSFIYVASANDINLKDEENRRWLIIDLDDSSLKGGIDIIKMRKDLPRVWGAAMHLFNVVGIDTDENGNGHLGVTQYIKDDKILKMLRSVQEENRLKNEWEDFIHNFISEKADHQGLMKKFIMSDFLKYCERDDAYAKSRYSAREIKKEFKKWGYDFKFINNYGTRLRGFYYDLDADEQKKELTEDIIQSKREGYFSSS